MEKRKNGVFKKKFILVTVLLISLLFFGALYYAFSQYRVTEVLVDGHEHYTADEIKEMVMPGGLLDNSLYLSLLYRNKEIKDVPFLESMDVEILSRQRIAIHVYEKKLAGCVLYLGTYMYFDREGIVVESSGELTKGVPQIRGLSFDHVVMHEQLPVEDKEVFGRILKVTQLLGKYELKADKIYFNPNNEISLVFGQAKVNLGTDAYIDEKVMQLTTILPSLDGKEGTLHMENFDENTTTIHFEQGK